MAGSAGDNFEIELREKEAFNTCWVFTPSIKRRGGETILTIEDTNWSLDESAWNGDIVTMTMRKYPGHHRPGDIAVTVDCNTREGEINGVRYPLA